MATKKSKVDEAKKEEFLESVSKPRVSSVDEVKRGENPPFYIFVLVFLFGVVFALALFVFFGFDNFDKNKVNGKNDMDINSLINDLDYRTVPITMIFSNDCKSCEQTNTFETLFQVRKIPYRIYKVEASSEEGKDLIKKFELKVLPTALIDAEKLKFYPKTISDFDLEVSKGTMKKIDRVYVAPEINLDEKTFYSVFFLEKPVFCTSSKPNVVLFDDYYTPQFSYNRKKLYEFISDFNDLVGINFVYAQTGFSQDRNSQLGNLALYCASQQGKFVELERTMTGIYCNNPFGGDETILTDPEIKGCWTLSNHFGKPLNLFEIDVAFSRTSLDKEDFKKCFDN
ncbi:MAG: hypothetical protein QXI10_01425, partial [Candidatus Diapherotrites archaeon]